MRKLSGLIITAIITLNIGCGQQLVSNLNEYETLGPDTKYKILSENTKGFELAVYIKNHDFYTEKRHLIAEAKNQFRKIAKSICLKNEKEAGNIDNNAFIESVDLGSKTAHIRNWIYYKRKE